ncbi:MAG: hypothetical protein ACOC1I_08820 [Spirochaetota bacterium]
MEILVNREPLDFKLENEASVGEVVDGLAEWLGSGQFAIISLNVNTNSYAIHDRSAWADISVDDVERLAVEALPLQSVDHATLVAVDEYCSILAEALRTQNVEAIPELAEELPYVRRRIAQFVPSLASPDGVAEVLADARLEAGEMPDARSAGKLADELDSIRSILQIREREYRQPERELALTLGQLSAMREQLIEVPVQLQTGKERAAMQTVIGLTEMLGRAVRLVPLVEASDGAIGIDVQGVRSFAESLAPFLAELKEAFEIQDTVLLGDLLEYEVAPRLERLEELLPGESSGEAGPQ